MSHEWIHKWTLVELSASNRLFTWIDNKDQQILAKIDRIFVTTDWESNFPIDRIFVTTDWESNFPIARVKSLDTQPSDHNPLMLDTRDNGFW
jgi:endonuclease/exonuclease/phosphatase family metal-dependent hydrolase